MEKLVTDLATMHGKFWMDERLLEIPWLIDWRAESLQLGIEMTQTAWKALAENEPDRYPKDLFEVLDRSWINNTVEWLGRYADRPWTLTHIDYELDNILIDTDGPIILDWQSIMRSHPGVDLGWLLAASHNQETLDAEPALLTLYRKNCRIRWADMVRRGTRRSPRMGDSVSGLVSMRPISSGRIGSWFRGGKNASEVR